MWCPAFEWWNPDHSSNVLLHITEIFSWSMPIDRSSLEYCLPFTNSEKIADVVMLKFVGIRAHCAYEIGILNHGEEETFRHGAQDGVVDRQRFWSGRECDRLEFDSHHVIACESPDIQAAVWANSVTGSGFTRFANNFSSKNLKVILESASMLIM